MADELEQLVAETEADAEVKPAPKKASRAPKAKSTPSVPKGYVKIQLEENDEIPPTGLYLGLNGRGYLLKPGEVVAVPTGLVDILDNAVMTVPQVDPNTRRVVGYRDRLRYPYRKA